MNQQLKILIACEFSGTVRDAFTALGHDATSCDILPSETPGKHYQGDVMDIINNGWDLMVAFPPCTHLAVSGAAWFEQKIRDGRQQEGIDFFMSMINAPIDRIAVENPIGIMSSKYKKPDQVINPFYFGDNVRKPTCLWLKNLPKLFWADSNTLFDTKTSTEPELIEMQSRKTGRNRTYSKWEYEASCNQKERANIRSKTFSGIAAAMASQWSEYLKETICNRMIHY